MLTLLVLLALACLSVAAPFEYLSYANITAQLHALAVANPDILRVYSAQKEFAVPHTGRCKEYVADGSLAAKPCTVWIAELTKRATLGSASQRPELLVSGELHGDEVVGPQAAMGFLNFMVRNYRTDEYVRTMVDSRVVTLVPTANAIGYEMNRREEWQHERGRKIAVYDPNRDFAFSTHPRGCMRTVAARVFNALFRAHPFRILITFHGGTNVLGYEWGDNTHCTGKVCKPAPDLAIMHALAQRMADVAGPAGKFEPRYPIGTMGKLVYPVNGGMEDWAYGASWAGQGVKCRPRTFGGYPRAKTQYADSMTRCITYLVETGLSKRPAAHTLGDSEDMLLRNATGDGHVPRNVRLLLTALDALEPHIVLPDRTRMPFSSSTDKKIRFTWQVGGAFVVDGTYLQWGTKSGLSGATRVQRGVAGAHRLGVNATTFEDVIEFNTKTIPLSSILYVRVAAVADNSLDKKVPGSSPDVLPQSHLQHARSQGGVIHKVGNRSVVAKRVIYSRTIRVESRESHVLLTTVDTVRWGWGQGKIRAPSDGATLYKLYPEASEPMGLWLKNVMTEISHQTWVLILAGFFFVVLPCFLFILCVCCKDGRDTSGEDDPEIRKELLIEDLLDEEVE